METMIFANIMCVVILGVSGLSFDEECPSGWEGFGNKCYMFPIDRLTGKEAYTGCENDRANLASVKDSSINNFLWRNNGDMVWIGLQTTDDKTRWYWNDGNLFASGSHFQWFGNEPDSTDVCARLRPDDKIAGRECSHVHYYFICQAENNPGSWSEVGNYWYYFSSEKGNYYFASKYCFDRNGYLARKDVVNALASDQRHQNREYWLGLSRWFWTDDSPYVWHNFDPSETHMDGPDKCYGLHGSQNKWEILECSAMHYRICQRDKRPTIEPPSTTTPTTTTTAEIFTNPKTTKPASSTQTTSTSTTSTKTTTTPLEITPSPQTSTTTKVKSIETSSSTVASVTGNDTDSGLAAYTTSTDQPTIVVSSGEAKGQFDGYSILLYTLIVICALIIVLVVIIIVLLILSRRRVNKQSDKERLHTDAGDGENQPMAQLPGPSSQSTAQMNRHAHTTHGGNTATEQTSPTASDGVPIYAVVNKKRAETEQL